ncbi:MAG: LPS export ABC transporter ATP-binding protein [Planctomycetes bacterium]|jgi:lipopolysaccharide export system ATP-binding protein|nr:LPS export ABC transporter ATP-binding protein [Planctomycetota bacterium]MCL4729194.1 LPS export ABC transporter ATP-binding protein [Planctomycetota bacterium]
MAVLRGEKLTKRFGSRTVVRGVNVEVRAGEIVGLLGRNGAGKSTTFKMLMGVHRPDGGTVTLADKDVTRLPMYLRVRHGLGYLPQDHTLFARLTVEENLQTILETTALSRPDREKRLEELIAEFGLHKVRTTPAGGCSGGERRRLEIARTLISDPKVILLDEPFAGVDPIAVSDLRELVLQLSAKGIAILLTDHNVREVLPMTDRSYIIVDGQVIKEGPPREIAADTIVRKEYLGERFRLDTDIIRRREG